MRSPRSPNGAGQSVSGRIAATSGRGRGRRSSCLRGVQPDHEPPRCAPAPGARVSRQTTDHRAEGQRHRSRRPAAPAARRPSPVVRAASPAGSSHGGSGAEPADHQPGDRADVGQPRATRSRAAAAGRTSRPPSRRPARPPGPRRGRGASARSARHGDRDHGPEPEGGHARQPAAGQVRPVTSWLSTPATAIVSPDDVERNAAKAPAVDQPGQQLAARPADHQPRQLQHQRVGAAGAPPGRARRSGRARRRSAAAGRRGRAAPAPRASYGGPPGRRGWCRSGPPRAAGPWCRGRSR